MNRGNVLQSSPVQQMLAGGPNTWWSMIGGGRPSPPPPPPPPPQSPFSQPHFFPNQYHAPPPLLSPWHDHQQDFPDSLSQLLMGGLVSDEDKSALNLMQQVKKLENWEEQLLHHHHQQHQQHNSSSVNSMVESAAVKQENSLNNYGSSYGHGNVDFHGVKSNNWSNPMIPVSSPNSCISSLSNSMLDFSTTISNNKADGRHPPPDRSSECNSTATGGVSKKAKIQPSSSQSTFKVRKEKLGDRITALHQLVSPFGKTDTASVLLEAIGYIRFLQSQIEALSLPYLGSESGNMRHPQHSVQQGERNCLFPEDPGQLLNDNCMKLKGSALDQDSHQEPKVKDLRSRGLCLVPVSCTMQVGSDNGADYWAPALNGGFR
ncbi:hypothetical protein OSB04_021256 [Centaurea solstitialis]|uniref:BHLH domain-containing protein n=1 Tax=Centaurea solstitialis TaxID=347529 RepID=A0AA38SU67_9ASTR|nr:hypothetical protein OSB04_021256 [Centaurea solstitialis]